MCVRIRVTLKNLFYYKYATVEHLTLGIHASVEADKHYYCRKKETANGVGKYGAGLFNNSHPYVRSMYRTLLIL